MSATPVVGLTTYREQAAWGVWHEQADVLPTAYAEAVAATGGLPVLLPPQEQAGAAELVVERLDALVVSGGADVDPARYGEQPHPRTAGWRPDRDAWELALLDAAEAAGLPVLGVCRGMQVMAVHAGGRLEQHLPESVGDERHSPGGATYGRVRVATVPGSRVAALVGERVEVNCHHHQAVAEHPGFDRVGPRRRRHAGGHGAPRRPVRGGRAVAPRDRRRRRAARRAGPRGCQDAGVSTEVRVDVLGEPFTAETIDLPDDAEGAVVATLVHLAADGEGPSRGAVLHVHGFADYFFHAEHARWWAARGWDFYALDLRKYGRSLLPHQTAAFVTDLGEHHPEIEAAWSRLTERDGHARVVISAHSTGGLVTALWADACRPPELAGMVLNSPWLDLQGSALLRVVGTPVLQQLGARAPMREIKRTVNGLYARSLHRDHEGEFDFDLALKPIESFKVHAGWLRAVRDGHARLHRGLEVEAPVLVLASTRSSVPVEMGEDVHSTDVVLDTDQIRRWSSSIGRHVTYVGIPGARHDVVLSRAEPAGARARGDRPLARRLRRVGLSGRGRPPGPPRPPPRS